jgi:hypothetical protein
MAISLVFVPDLVTSIDGRLPHGMGVARLTDLPAEWSRQHQMVVFPRAERFGRRPARIIAEFSGRQQSGEPSRLEISASELVPQWFSSSG